MTTRNLLIIAGLPGFRANTKLTIENNNRPAPKQVVMDLSAIYEGLTLKPAPKPLAQQIKESAFVSAAPSRLQELLEKPKKRAPVRISDLAFQNVRVPQDFDVNLDTKQVYYKGVWWTEESSRQILPYQTRDKMASAYYEAKRQTKYQL